MIATVEIIKLNTGKKSNMVQRPTPFCKLSTINIGNYFLWLIDKHFIGNNPLKTFLTGKQLKSVIHALITISSHNKNLIKNSCVDRQALSRLLCYCRFNKECPVSSKCNSENVLYMTMENRKDINIRGSLKKVFRLFSYGHFY